MGATVTGIVLAVLLVAVSGSPAADSCSASQWWHAGASAHFTQNFVYSFASQVLKFENGTTAKEDGYVDLKPMDGQLEWHSQYHESDQTFWSSLPLKDTPVEPAGFTAARFSPTDLLAPIAHKGGRYASASVRMSTCRGDVRPEAYDAPDRYLDFARAASTLPLGNATDPDVLKAYTDYFTKAGTHFVLSATQGFLLEVLVADLPLSRPGSAADTPEKARAEILDAAESYLYAALNFDAGDPAAEPYWHRALGNETAERHYSFNAIGGHTTLLVDLYHCIMWSRGCKTEFEKVLETVTEYPSVVDEEVLPISQLMQHMFAPGEIPDLEERIEFMDAMLVQFSRRRIYSSICRDELWDEETLSCVRWGPEEYIRNTNFAPTFFVDGHREPPVHFGSRYGETYFIEGCRVRNAAYNNIIQFFAGYNDVTLEEEVTRCNTNVHGEDVFITRTTMLGYENGGVLIHTDPEWNIDLFRDSKYMSARPWSLQDGTHILATGKGGLDPLYTTVYLAAHPTLPRQMSFFAPAYQSYVYANATNRALMFGTDIEDRPWDYVVEYELQPRPFSINTPTGWIGEGPNCPSVQECGPGTRMSSVTTNPYRTYYPWEQWTPCVSGAYYYCESTAYEVLTKTPVASPREQLP